MEVSRYTSTRRQLLLAVVTAQVVCVIKQRLVSCCNSTGRFVVTIAQQMQACLLATTRPKLLGSVWCRADIGK